MSDVDGPEIVANKGNLMNQSWRTVISVLETLAFIVAVIMAIWFNRADAIILALVGAAAHSFNHPGGNSPV